MNEIVMKYLGLLVTLSGAVIMVSSTYFPSPYLQIEAFGISLLVMVCGLLAFVAGTYIMAKYDEEFMEKMMDRIGKILEFF